MNWPILSRPRLGFITATVVILACEGSPTGIGPDFTDSLIIDTRVLEDGWLDVEYSVQLTAYGGSGSDLVWSVHSGRLPPGLALEAAGRIAGVPTFEGTWAFGVQVKDQEDKSATRLLELRVCPAPPVMSVGDVATYSSAGSDECEWFIPAGSSGDEYWIVAVRDFDGWGAEVSAAVVVRSHGVAVATSLASGPASMQPTLGAPGGRTGAGGIPGDTPALRHVPFQHRWGDDVPSLAIPNRSFRVMGEGSGSRAPTSRQFNVASSCDEPVNLVSAKLIAESDHLVVYQDSLQSETDPAHLPTVQEIVDFYEAFGQQVIDDYYGGVSDVNQDGKVALLIFPPADITAAAWVQRKDLMDPADCSNSNNMELVYVNIRVIKGASEGNFYSLGMLTHEIGHISSIGRALAGRGFHPAWIEEAAACVLGELSGRSAMDAAGGPSLGEQLTRSHFEEFGRDNYYVGYRAYGAGRYLSLQPNDLLSNGYWGGWLFYRFLGDRYGDQQVLTVQNTAGLAGTDAHPLISGGETFNDLLFEYAAAVALNLAGQESWISSYDLHSILAAEPLQWPDTFGGALPAGFPWAVIDTGFVSGTFAGALAQTGLRLHIFRSDGTGKGLSGRLEMPPSSSGRLVIVRVR